VNFVTYKLVLIAVLLAGLLGCAGVVSPVGNGLLFTSVKGPVGATPVAPATKKGESCASNILGLFATGDASIDSAKRDGGISEVSAVDHDSFSVLILYARYCTIVRGS
jgi:hypothetical protein